MVHNTNSRAVGTMSAIDWSLARSRQRKLRVLERQIGIHGPATKGSVDTLYKINKAKDSIFDQRKEWTGRLKPETTVPSAELRVPPPKA